MTRIYQSILTSAVAAIAIGALLVASAGDARAQAWIDGISGRISFAFTAKAAGVAHPVGAPFTSWATGTPATTRVSGLPSSRGRR